MATEIISKRCPQCKQIKPLSEFNKDRSRKDGLQAYCKSCLKAYQQSEKGRAVFRKGVAKYQQTPKGKAVMRKAAVKYQQTPKGKVRMRRATAKFNDRNPNYPKAKSAVNHAVAAGRLPRVTTRLCRYCQKPAQQYHHWHGYEPEHWLDVVPACLNCHTKEHRKIA